MIPQKTIAVALLLVMFGAGTAHASDADVIRAFGLLGTSAINCSAPAGPQNPYITFAVAGTRLKRTLKMGLPNLDGTFAMRGAIRIDDQRIAAEMEDATRQFEKTVIIKSGDVWYTDRSDDPDGRPLIRDGRFASSTALVPRFQRCPGR
jgi:hypothetical protein